MASYRPRGGSPTRYVVDNRPSNGPVYSTGFDDQFGPSRRESYANRPIQRSAGDSSYNAQPISTKSYSATPHGPAQTQTKYVIRPQRNSSLDDPRREPLRIMPAPMSPTRDRTRGTDYDRPRSPAYRTYHPPNSSGRYTAPAGPGRQGHRRYPSDWSANLYPSQPGRRDYRGSTYLPGGGYSAPHDLLRNGGEDGFSYITPQQHFERSGPPPERRARRSSYTRSDRPVSTAEFEEWKRYKQSRQDGNRDREYGPSAATRHFDRMGDPGRRMEDPDWGNYSDNERDYDAPRRRSSMRAPVALHQSREGNYSPGQDDLRRRRVPRYEPRAVDGDLNYSSERENPRPSKHEHRSHRHRHHDDDREPSDGKHKAVAAGLGGVAAAGIATALVKKPKEDDHSDPEEFYTRKSLRVPGKDEARRDSSREARVPREVLGERQNEVPRDQRRDSSKLVKGEKVEDESRPDGTQPKREKRRHRHHRQSREFEAESDSYSDDHNRGNVSRRVPQTRDGRNRDVSDSEDSPRHLQAPSIVERRAASHERHRSSPQIAYQPEKAPEEGAKQLQLVEPTKEATPEVKLKGILKPPRVVPFPEDPNPTRDGVAPLRDTKKAGVPDGARWTKVNRMLVNPAALDAAQERYEERDDYVIVLRALSTEEVTKLAELTSEIRGKFARTTLRSAANEN